MTLPIGGQNGWYDRTDRTNSVWAWIFMKSRTVIHAHTCHAVSSIWSIAFFCWQVDFSADDNGLWAIYSMSESNNTAVAKLSFDPNKDDLNVDYIWNISLNHKQVRFFLYLPFHTIYSLKTDLSGLSGSLPGACSDSLPGSVNPNRRFDFRHEPI